MAARSLTRTVVGMGLRPLLLFPCVSMAKTTFVALSHRSFLSLSHRSFLSLSHRSFLPPPVVSFSLIAPRSDLANYSAATDAARCKKKYSVDELLDWFDKEAMEANDTIQKLRSDYEIIFAKLFSEEQRPVLVEDVEDLHDFRWELLVKKSQASKDYSFDDCFKSIHENRRRCAQTPITEINYIKNVDRDVNQLLGWFERETMKFKEMIEKLRKDHAQKLQLANDEEDNAVLLEELKEMCSNLLEKQSKAIYAKASAAMALIHKEKAAELLSCFFIF